MAPLAELSEVRISQDGPPSRGEFAYVDISSIDRETKRAVLNPNRIAALSPGLYAARYPGHGVKPVPQPQRGCVRPVCTNGHNPVGLDFVLVDSPRVVRASQPWANCLYPLGVSTSVALPPLAEQTRLAEEVERRLTVVEELQAVVSANLRRATRLRQSIIERPSPAGWLDVITSVATLGA